MVVDLGPLVGKAVTIVSASNGNGTCRFQHPLIFPNKAGSTLFVYHDAAVKEFRDMAVRVGQMTTAAKRARMIALWNGVAGLQLGSTLTYLAPANDIGIFPVTINTVPSAAAGR
ncbi:hypothetical protein OEZ86_007153 [Tetradesmus obliquus]|nr:hypothetical protein OEZ86_007153 [Tetradesmus obliquus]